MRYLLLLIFCLTFTLVDAQKYGHVNAGNILELLPEVKQADSSLEKYNADLMGQREGMVKSFEQKYADIIKKQQSGQLSQIDLQKKEEQLRKEQEKIVAFEREIQQKIAVKREELLKPILTKIDNAIKQVGKENGYSMIFDVSIGALLFATDSSDVTAQVKSKLGL